MELRLESIHIENFQRVKALDFTFAENGLFVVSGLNKDAAFATSNGTGKSTIFADAITWCLFGRRIRDNGTPGDLVITNDGQQRECYVGTSLCADDGRKIEISRGRLHSRLSNRAEILINGVASTSHSVRDTQQLIDSVLGIDFKTFTGSVIFSNALSSFASLTDGERKGVRDTLLGLDLYDRAYEIASSDLLEQERALQEVGTTISETENLLQSKVCSVENSKAALSVLRERSLDEVLLLQETLSKSIEAVSPVDDQGLLLLSSRIGETKSEIRSLIKSIGDLENNNPNSLIGSPCPECGRVYLAGHLRKHRNLWTKESLQACSLHDEQEALLEALTRELGEKTEARQKYLDYCTLREEQKLARKQLEAIDGKEKIYRDSIADDKLYCAAIRSKLRRLALRSAILEKEIQALAFWKEGFGPSGIKSLLMDSFLPFISSQLSSYSDVLTDGQIQVQLHTSHHLKTGGFRDSLAIHIESSSGARDYGSCSEGEKRRIDVCLLFALSDLVALRAREKWNILILDEVFNSLDEVGAYRMALLLRRIARTRAVYVISHESSLVDSLDGTNIRVMRENNEVSIAA